MSTPEKTRVLVIGAGISGLTAARQVKKQRPEVEVVVLEARERLGGRICSERLGDGSTIDLGAHFLHGVCDHHPLAQIAKEHPEWGQLVEMDWETCPDFQQGGEQISEQQLKRCEELYEKTWDLYESGQKHRRAQMETDDTSLWAQLQRDFDWSQLSASEQVARPLLSKDGMLKLPRLEAVIYGRRAPFSGCCGCSLLSFFDAEYGVAVICTRQTCRRPALQLQPLSQPRRLQLWGPFLALTGGLLPRHRPPPASCVENALAPEESVFSMFPQHVALLVEDPSSPEMNGPVLSTAPASERPSEDFEREDLSRASEEAIVTYEDMMPEVPWSQKCGSKSSPPPSPCGRSGSSPSSPVSTLTPRPTSIPEPRRCFSERAARLAEAVHKRPQSQPRWRQRPWRLVPPSGFTNFVHTNATMTSRRR